MRGRGRFDESLPRSERSDWWGVVLDTPDPPPLARFYAELLGWELTHEEPNYCVVNPPGGVAYLGFHISTGYVRPVWPPAEGAQQQMLHLDFEVTDLAAAVAHAVELGAEVATFQPQDEVRVILDPDGHPFCLYADG
jgi:catechol 2,3-dioxygenase-like lactoylglutathione lyase family enzyme